MGFYLSWKTSRSLRYYCSPIGGPTSLAVETRRGASLLGLALAAASATLLPLGW